jgi:hypothetical protein
MHVVTLHIKPNKQNMASKFMKVKLKQQATLPWKAPSPTIVLNVFNYELTSLHLTQLLQLG